MPRRLLLLLAAACAAPLRAQVPSDPSLPEHTVLNPLSASRTPLLALPYQQPQRGGWRVRGFSLQYGNAVENESGNRVDTGVLLDGEFLRAELTVGRDLGTRGFLTAQGGITGAYNGFADGFFIWYHRLIRYDQPERDTRPRNRFGYFVSTPDGRVLPTNPYAVGLSDLRLTAGWRWLPAVQSAVTVTLPTATPLSGYGRGVPTVAMVHTLRTRPFEWLILETTGSLGYAPRQGALSRYQRTVLYGASSGLRLHLWGGNWIYGYAWYHSAYYRGTFSPTLDRREFTADFGWIFRNRRTGREWIVGLGEDLQPGDPGIDLILKVQRRF